LIYKERRDNEIIWNAQLKPQSTKKEDKNRNEEQGQQIETNMVDINPISITVT
jgi:hypothetical protein